MFVKLTSPDSSWLVEYRDRAVGYREALFRNAMHGAAILEGARQANLNLEDLGLIMLDAKDLESLAKNVGKLSVLSILLANSSVSTEMRDKTMDYAAASMFGPGYERTAMSDMMRNLSVPEHSPFGVSSMARLSDPQLMEKYKQISGIAPQSTSVAQSSGVPRVDELAREAGNARSRRLKGNNDGTGK